MSCAIGSNTYALFKLVVIATLLNYLVSKKIKCMSFIKRFFHAPAPMASGLNIEIHSSYCQTVCLYPASRTSRLPWHPGDPERATGVSRRGPSSIPRDRPRSQGSCSTTGPDINPNPYLSADTYTT